MIYFLFWKSILAVMWFKSFIALLNELKIDSMKNFKQVILEFSDMYGLPKKKPVNFIVHKNVVFLSGMVFPNALYILLVCRYSVISFLILPNSWCDILSTRRGAEATKLLRNSPWGWRCFEGARDEPWYYIAWYQRTVLSHGIRFHLIKTRGGESLCSNIIYVYTPWKKKTIDDWGGRKEWHFGDTPGKNIVVSGSREKTDLLI